MQLIAEGKGCRLYHGNATDYVGDADVVLTNPYAPIPEQLRDKPMFLANLAERKAEMQGYIGKPLVLTTPYCPLPAGVADAPMLIAHTADHKGRMEEHCGRALTEIGTWGTNGRCRIWCANLVPRPLDLTDIGEEIFEPNRGWFPLDLPLRLLEHYGYDNRFRDQIIVVWDGFCGRGTTGKACQLLGLQFIGIDKDIERVKLAQRYLGLA